MRLITPQEVQASAVQALGLDPSASDLSTVEAIACALRRAAGLYCPCPPQTLIEAVVTSVRGLVDSSMTRDAIEDTLEALIANRDLFEAQATDARETRLESLLYLVPPAFVRRKSGKLLLLGVLPDATSPIPIALSKQVDYVNHLRVVPDREGDVAETLLSIGFSEIPSRGWLEIPDCEAASHHLQRMNGFLDIAKEAPRFAGLQILDPHSPVRYYRGRWKDGAECTGRYLGRRPQAYGAALWCYAELMGDMVRLVDFPLRTSHWRGCDDAFRLQAAIDHERGHPQVYRLVGGPGTTTVVQLFSPIPRWVRRRFESIGEPVSATTCLLAYRFPNEELDEEIRFLTEYLWLVQDNRTA